MGDALEAVDDLELGQALRLAVEFSRDVRMAGSRLDAALLKLIELGAAELQEFGFGVFGGWLHGRANSGAESLAG